MLKSVFLLLMALPAFASYEGLDTQFLESQRIAETSRACCNFVSHPVLDSLGLFQFLDPEKLGSHSYHQKEKDPMGLIYTCKGGFVDVAHLRDNADWTAHILYHLPKWIGSGKTIDARNEGGFKSRRVYFPKMDPKKIAELSQDDLAKISIAMGFGFATLHEIVTGFSIAVSFPITLVMYERASSFSVEDQYSNLLGAHLGAEAAQARGPYEEELTKKLSRTIQKLSPLSLAETKAVHASLHHKWWQKDLLGRNRMVAKRNYGHSGEIFPERVNELKQCANMDALPVEVPDKLSNGMSVSDFFLIQGEINKKFVRQIAKRNKSARPFISQKEFPAFISTIKEMNDEEFHSPK